MALYVWLPEHDRIVFSVHCVWQQEMVDWQQVPGNVSQYDILLPHGNDGDRYQFGIASQSHDNGSSGVTWTDCVFLANASKHVYCRQYLPCTLKLVQMVVENAQNINISTPDLQIVIFNNCFETVISD